MKDVAILVANWKSVELLGVSIPSLIKSSKSNFEIIVVLNEADNESINYLKNMKITYYDNPRNDGPSAIDYAIPYMKEVGFKYVANINDDMLFSEGWDVELINLLEERKPCTVSASMIEPIHGNRFIYDDLGNFFNPGNHDTFNQNVKNNKYVTNLSISYNPPILCTFDDYISVGGYSDYMKQMWIDLKGKGLDDDFAYRLYKKYCGKFTFIKSNKSFVYHGGSLTIKKLPFQSGASAFYETNGLTLDEFRNKINLCKEV
jgi:glycosyltransferase involved in cell wall biosynthesis